jgi:hypothetical protein
MWTGKWGQAFKTVKQTKNVILASPYADQPDIYCFHAKNSVF